MTFNQTWIRKNRCKNGAYAIIQMLKDFTADDIIIFGFVHTDNEKAKELLYKYEQMILLAKMDEDRYQNKRDELHTTLAKFIKQNELYSDWADFIHFLNNNLQHKTILNVYKSETMETWNYLTGYNGKIVYGVTRDNKPLITNEYYGDWDYELHKRQYQLERKKITRKQFTEFVQSEINDRRRMEANENLSDIAILEMMPFINERTHDIYPKDWMPHAELHRLQFPRQWKKTEFYQELLDKRNYILDRKGVKLFLKNAGMIDEVLFVEDVTKDNKSILLYRASSYKHGSTMGYYIPSDKDFFSPWKFSNGPEAHANIENFILELYAELTVGLERDRLRFSALVEVEDLNHLERYRETNIYVQYQTFNALSDRDELKGRRNSTSRQKPHERRFSIRKLKEGQKASEEALERAREYGIELQDGYTFVKGYSVGIKDMRKPVLNKK